MIKKFLIILFLVLMSVYLVIAATAFNRRSGNQICQGMELLIKDSINYGFVSKKEIEKTLKRKKLSPVGKKQDEINIRQIEEVLNEHPFIDEAECYYTPSGKIGIKVIQRIPLLRIMANNGENYYLDSKGKIMPIPENIAHVTVATGFIGSQVCSTRALRVKPVHKQQSFLESTNRTNLCNSQKGIRIGS